MTTPRSRMTGTTAALAFLFGAVLAPAVAPAGLPPLPVEPAAPAPQSPESPAVAHPARLTGPIPDSAPSAVSFEDAVRATPPQAAPDTVRFHIQGEILDDPSDTGGVDPGVEDLEPPPPPSPPPAVEPVLQPGTPAAPGDAVTEFAGLANTGWIPPDTILGTGPGHVVEAVNSGFAVYSKTGGVLQGYTTFDAFFTPILPSGWDGFLFDPRVLYTPVAGGHYVMLALGRDTTNQDSLVFVAVTDTDDPTGTWWLYSFSQTDANPADSDAWLDYCGLGADEWGIYVTCNAFLWTGGFKYATLWSLDPAMYSGGAGDGWAFWNLTWNDASSAFSLQPAVAHSSAHDEATFFVNSRFASGNQALLWKLTGDRTNQPTLARATVSTPAYNGIFGNVDQPGSSTDLDGGDARIMNAVYMNRKVYTALTDDVNNDGRSSGWLVLRLDVDASSLDWSDLVWVSTTATSGGFYFFYPAITVEGSDLSDPNLAVYGSWTDTETVVSSTTRFASGVYKIFDDQPTSDSGQFISFESGDASYVVLDGSGRNRWGDYSGAAFDWSTGDAWGGVEVAGTSNTWRTRIRAVELADDCADSYEPDDGSGQASTISSGSPQSHSICPAGDEDWVTFTLGATSAVALETSGASGDTRMWLYDSSLGQVEFDDDGGTSLFSAIDRLCGVDPLPAGTYYVQVDEFGDDHEIPVYNLGFTVLETCSVSCPADLTLSNTTLTGTQTHRASATITLGPALVVDGTSIEVIAGQRVVIGDGTEIGGSFSAGTDADACTQ